MRLEPAGEIRAGFFVFAEEGDMMNFTENGDIREVSRAQMMARDQAQAQMGPPDRVGAFELLGGSVSRVECVERNLCDAVRELHRRITGATPVANEVGSEQPAASHLAEILGDRLDRVRDNTQGALVLVEDLIRDFPER